jgi:hypothetical protein
MPRTSNRMWSRTLSALVCAAVLGAPVVARAAPRRGQVVAVEGREASGVTTIRIRGTGTPTFTAYKLERPARVVIDLAGAELSETITDGGEGVVTSQLNSWAVGQVSTSASGEGAQRVVRVVVGLARPGSYKV